MRDNLRGRSCSEACIYAWQGISNGTEGLVAASRRLEMSQHKIEGDDDDEQSYGEGDCGIPRRGRGAVKGARRTGGPGGGGRRHSPLI